MEDVALLRGVTALRCDEVEKRFAVSPLMLSAWVCVASRADDYEIETVLRSDIVDLWAATDDYYRRLHGEEDSFTPGAHVVAEMASG